MLPIIGISYGDAAGIGPELIARLIAKHAFTGCCRPLLIGDARVFRQGMEIIGQEMPLHVISRAEEAIYGDTPDVLDIRSLSPEDYTLGKEQTCCGEDAYQSMKHALDLLKAKKISGFLYAPQNKTSFVMAGHELDSMDLICRELEAREYGELNVLDKVCTVRVTSHIPLKDVSVALDAEGILRTIRFGDRCLCKMGFSSRRIAVAGLNPHNGENGLCGTEELEIIAPAVRAAQAEGIDAHGPFSPDTLFVRALKEGYDMVVTMYHDQGQIAMKLMDFRKIVTVIGGPDYPVATPAHGTAFGIAGKGIADTSATEYALRLICRAAASAERSGG